MRSDSGKLDVGCGRTYLLEDQSECRFLDTPYTSNAGGEDSAQTWDSVVIIEQFTTK